MTGITSFARTITGIKAATIGMTVIGADPMSVGMIASQ